MLIVCQSDDEEEEEGRREALRRTNRIEKERSMEEEVKSGAVEILFAAV